MKSKRIIVATFMGLLCGLACFGLASGGKTPLPWPVAVQIIVSRTLIGFALGASSLFLFHWSLRGALFGILFSLPLAFSCLMAPENPEFSHAMIFGSTLFMGMIYGIFIELVTSVFFRAPLSR